MSLASQEEGPRFESRRDLAQSFHRGLGGKCDKSTLLIITCLQPLHMCIHVGEYVSYLPKVGVSSANKTDRHDVTLDVESGVKHQLIQFNPVFPSGLQWQM